jgi:hypothetical protein
MRGILWTLLFFIALAGLLFWSSPLKRPLVALRLALEEQPETLPLPVAGVPPAALRDTWGAPRGNGTNASRHRYFRAQGNARKIHDPRAGI